MREGFNPVSPIMIVQKIQFSVILTGIVIILKKNARTDFSPQTQEGIDFQNEDWFAATIIAFESARHW